MKKQILAILMLVCLFSACSGSLKETQSSETKSSFSSSHTDSSASENTLNKTMDQITLEEITSYSDDSTLMSARGSWAAENQNEEIVSWSELVDNKTPMQQLIPAQKLDADRTFFYGSRLYTGFWVSELGINIPIQSYRETSRFTDDTYGFGEIVRGYTVLQCELGGYMFLFVKYYEMSGVLEVKSSVYMPQSLSYDDFAGIAAGSSVDDVIAVDRVAMLMKKNPNYYDLKGLYTIHLLQDGILYIQYEETSDDIIVESIEYHSDYILPNYFMNKAADVPLDSLVHQHDFTVFAEDWPF